MVASLLHSTFPHGFSPSHKRAQLINVRETSVEVPSHLTLSATLPRRYLSPLTKMKNLNQKLNLPTLIIAVFVLVGSGAALASQLTGKPNVQVTLFASTLRNGQQVSIDKASMLMPGEPINWTITSANEGAVQAANYSVVGQIPGGTVFVENSAKASGANITFSIDGGKSFSNQPTIEQRQPDGSIKYVAAPASTYTQVRYQWSNPLSPGQKVAAYYQVRVK